MDFRENPSKLYFQFFKLLTILQIINCVSIWEPFCDEDKLFTPYVRVFQKGRRGAILRDRGPGFIDLGGLNDIYVCTNGIVMMYYAKTTAMGEVFEHGELHWTPHHCELYNPSANSGMKSDFPKKCLLSILLIGHPHDYRLPAIQMFVAPLYDKKFGAYVNATSLIMIGNDGECLIEKGMERARLRVRVSRPSEFDAIDRKNEALAEAELPGELETYPSMFCQLDIQRKLGQNENGFITLAIPDNSTFIPFRPSGSKFDNTTYLKEIHSKRETGPGIFPRYKATENLLFRDSPHPSLLQMADQVYAALLGERKISFVGCLKYPEFSFDQLQIIHEKWHSYYKLLDETEFQNFTPVETGIPFWEQTVTYKWLDPEKNETHFEHFRMSKINESDWPEDYAAASEEVKKAQDELDKEREDQKAAAAIGPPDAATLAENAKKIKEYEKALFEQEVIFSIWPYKAAYNELIVYLSTLQKALIEKWKALREAVMIPGMPDDFIYVPEQTGPFGMQLRDALINSSDVLAIHKEKIAEEMSRTKYLRRYEPYNPKLVEEYNLLLGNFSQLQTLLKMRTQQIGPNISNIETMAARYKVFKGVTSRVYDDLVNAIKYIDKTGGPAKPYVNGDPFDRTFADTMIEIADSLRPDGSYISENEPDYQNSKACHAISTVKETCSRIKPTTQRAFQLLKNREGKGADFETDDNWRQKVLDLVEEIFHKVCPYISEAFPVAINRLVKGYLMGDPAGTGLFAPVNGSRLEVHDHNYQGLIYNSTYEKMSPSNWTRPPTADPNWQPPPKLNAKTTFWDHIIDALESCKDNSHPMQFWHNEEGGDKPSFVTYRKFFPNNNTEVHYDVEELFMQEKADQEYSFNWAIEMNWRMFATVLGICMPGYENKIPLISTRFYALYSQDFLSPLRQIWMSNRDNPVLKVILGNFYGPCKADKWARMCMEASYVESGDRAYRPPRYLYVNAFTEMNYFTTGPMTGSSGMLSLVV